MGILSVFRRMRPANQPLVPWPQVFPGREPELTQIECDTLLRAYGIDVRGQSLELLHRYTITAIRVAKAREARGADAHGGEGLESISRRIRADMAARAAASSLSPLDPSERRAL